MNERIKELAERAGLQMGTMLENYTTPIKTITMEQKKFAELIVKECIEINKQELAFNAFERLLNIYKEHFGVK